MVKKNLFGSTELATFYQICKDFIFEHKFYEAYRLENTEIEAVLTLFNFYRYTKTHKTGLIRVEYWCLVSQQWKTERAKKDLKYCYTIPFLNLPLTSLIIIQDHVIRKIVTYLRKKYLENKNSLLHYEDKLVEVLKKYLRYRSVILQNYANHTKHLTKWLWRYFWDKSIISNVIKIEGHRSHLGHYLFYQKHIPKLARINVEYPNFLPLLSQIKPIHWDNPNLFSYRYWVTSIKGEEPRRRVKDFRVAELPYCESKQQWRWIKRQSPQFIRIWQCHNWSCREYVLAVLMQPGVSEKLPVCLQIIIFMYGHLFDYRHISDKNKERLLRLFIRYAIDYWKNEGFKALRRYLKGDISGRFHDIIDYLASDKRGLPSTWERLVERSVLWHRQLLEEQQRQQDEAHQQQLLKSWEGYIPYYKIKEVEFTALTTGKALYEEGQRMGHCIFTYTERCHAGYYLVFSVKYAEKLGKEVKQHYSTLGLYRNKQNQKWQIEQHRGKYNQSVSQYLERIAKQFFQVLNHYL